MYHLKPKQRYVKSVEKNSLHIQFIPQMDVKSTSSSPFINHDVYRTARPEYEYFTIPGGFNLEGKEYVVKMKRCTICLSESKIWESHANNGCRNSLLEAVRSF